MRGGFWAGLITGTLLGVVVAAVLSPEARAQMSGMTDRMDMGNVGRRIGRAARQLAQQTGVDDLVTNTGLGSDGQERG